MGLRKHHALKKSTRGAMSLWCSSGTEGSGEIYVPEIKRPQSTTPLHGASEAEGTDLSKIQVRLYVGFVGSESHTTSTQWKTNCSIHPPLFTDTD